MSRFSKGLICLFGLPMLCALTIFTIFFTMKLSDRLTSWSWVKIFSPLWIANILIIGMVGFGFRMGLKTFLWSALSSISFFIFSVMLPRKLDRPDDPDLNWPYVFIPLWVFLGLFQLLRTDNREIRLSRGDSYQTSTGEQITILPKPKYRTNDMVYLIYYNNAIVTLFIYTILECVSLSVTPLSWYIKYIPFFYFMAITVLGLLSMTGSRNIWSMLAPVILCCFYIVLFFYLIDKLRVFAVVMIPAYIGLIGLSICGIFVICYIN